MQAPAQITRHPVTLLVALTSPVFIWSAIQPADRGVWLFESLPGVLGVSALALTARRFRFSGLAYVLVGFHFTILAIGAKYTYAGMPLFLWLQEALHLSRNHYDRVGHLAQGFFPALLVREVLLRTTPLGRGKMLCFLSVCVCLALSAFWELIEWWVVLLCYRDQGPQWLGMQGDPWDAQSDMLMALIGSIISLWILSRAHDRSLSRLESPGNS